MKTVHYYHKKSPSQMLDWVLNTPLNGISNYQLLNVFFLVACVVNYFKIDFSRTDFFYNFVILIKFCKIRYLILEKHPLFTRNQVICIKIWKLWWAPTTVEFNIFAKILYTFTTYQSIQKSVRDFFYFL